MRLIDKILGRDRAKVVIVTSEGRDTRHVEMLHYKNIYDLLIQEIRNTHGIGPTKIKVKYQGKTVKTRSW